jgi:hypothetical protein
MTGRLWSGECRFCRASRGRWWPYCTACDSLFGVPILVWVFAVWVVLAVAGMVSGFAATRLGAGG